jgi:hypothetical protein
LVFLGVTGVAAGNPTGFQSIHLVYKLQREMQQRKCLTERIIISRGAK